MATRKKPAPTPVQEFAALMKKHKLSHLRTAELIGVSRHAVGSWLCQPDDPRHRQMPMRHLAFLKAVLASRPAP